MENGTCTVLWRTHGCSFGSIVALEWLAAYRLCRIEMPLETGERTYVRLNPARQTPTLLLEDGRALSESLAILQHLAARDLCRKLGYPQGSAEFDELNFALALLHTECHSAWGPVLSGGRRRNHDGKGAGARGEPMAGSTSCSATASGWPAKGRAWPTPTSRVPLVGDGLGYFDLQHDFPRLHRHLEKLEQDPAVRFAHAIEDRLPAQSCGEFRER